MSNNNLEKQNSNELQEFDFLVNQKKDKKDKKTKKLDSILNENKSNKKTRSLNDILSDKNDENEELESTIKHFKPEKLVPPIQKPIEKIKPKKTFSTNLSLNIKVYNKYIDYLPSDFTKSLVRSLFISTKSNFPKNAKVSLELQPNDTERNLKVIVSVDKYYKDGILVEQPMIFKPFWIIGFKTYTLLVVNERPIESLYRVNNIHDFSYQEARKIIHKKLSNKKYDKKYKNINCEDDYLRIRELKNWYIEQYVNKLNNLQNVTWECVPTCKLYKSQKMLNIKLYVVINKVKNDITSTKKIYADSFNVKLKKVLDFSKTATKEIDIDTIMYLVALNATYKNIRIFYYDTLYSLYKLLCAKLLSYGYALKDISANNLANLKIIDFSKHFFCRQKMFNDRLLHIMNLISADEQYYRMKYAYTLQKNPSLLYSDFIVTEFKTNAINELSTIIKNLENDYWNERINELGKLSNGDSNPDKQFYINNYNVLEVTNNDYKTVEDFLMGTIKNNKDEISRLNKLGEEILALEEKPRFTNKELRDLKKATKKLDNNYDNFSKFKNNHTNN